MLSGEIALNLSLLCTYYATLLLFFIYHYYIITVLMSKTVSRMCFGSIF